MYITDIKVNGGRKSVILNFIKLKPHILFDTDGFTFPDILKLIMTDSRPFWIWSR